MFLSPPKQRRGGVLSLTLAGLSLVTIGTVAVVSFAPAGSTSTAAAAKAKGKHMLQRGEVATVFHLVGIDPEALASAGVTSLQCDTLFSTGTAFCLQAERLTQLQLAHRNLNLAADKAVHPSSPGATDGSGQQLSVGACQTALTDLETAVFQGVTGEFSNATVQKLTKIRANRHWGLPAPYLTVDRSDEQWLALRGALVAKRYAQSHNLELAGPLTQIITTAEADVTVAQALQDLAGGLNGVQQSWSTHENADIP